MSSESHTTLSSNSSRRRIDFSPADFTYVLLPGRKPQQPEAMPIHMEALARFSSSWKGVLSRNGVQNEVPVERSFTNADLISVLLFRGSFAGLIVHTLFDLQRPDDRAHDYFKEPAGSVFLCHLDEQKITRAMTMEWLTIDNGLRRCQRGFSIAFVLTALAMRTQRAIGVPVSLQRARQDVGVDRLLMKFGSDAVLRDLDMHNTPVSIMMTHTPALIEQCDPLSLSYIESCWSRRVDYLGHTLPVAEHQRDRDRTNRAA